MVGVGSPMERVARALRGHVVRAGPGRLLAAAGLTAAVAVGAFVLSLQLDGTVSRSGSLLAPDWAGSTAYLDAFGVHDSDADGLADALETLVFGTDPLDFDTVNSSIPDGWLVRHGYDPLDADVGHRPAARPPLGKLPKAYSSWPPEYSPTLQDVYAYGKPADWNETRGPYDNGLDPRKWELSNGFPLGWILHHGLDPFNATLGPQRLAGPSGLTVAEAFQWNTDPKRLDSDDDGLLDREEIQGPLDPRTGKRFRPTDPSRMDSAGNGVCDGYLVTFGIDPHAVGVAAQDPDRDGATTKQEHDWSRSDRGLQACKGSGLDPTRQRSGSSAIPDGWLVKHRLDPFETGIDARETQTAATDPGPALAVAGLPDRVLTVLDEYRVGMPPGWSEQQRGPWWGGTDPGKPDTDGDGLGDAWELRGILVQVSTQVGKPSNPPYVAPSDPRKADSDGDGLNDIEEVDATNRLGGGSPTDPARWDTDFDGINDAAELGLALGLDPTRVDSAGDLLPDGTRLELLESRAQRYRESSLYEFPGRPGAARDVLAVFASRSPDGQPLTAATLVQLVGPKGNLDGDEFPNLVDKDLDGDSLLNGWEVAPDLYAHSPFGFGDLPKGRAATDPLHGDTDGDGLPDSWEIQFGQPDSRVDRYSLDPSRWNSDAETEPDHPVPDGEEDLDDDGFRKAASAGAPSSKREPFTNAQEYSYKTDPTRFDTDEDGLADGWKVYWGLTYPAENPAEVPPSATRPLLGERQAEVVVVESSTKRFVVDPTALLPGEQVTGSVTVADPADLSQRLTIFTLGGVATLRFKDVQEADTNPYKVDTDGDGMADWWEIRQNEALPGLDSTGGCTAGQGPAPLVPDGHLDADRDGLTNLDESRLGTDPLCTDSDAAGVRDGEESAFGLNAALPSDDQTLLDSRVDSDHDGIGDFEELTGIRSVDYSYLGPQVRTLHDRPDSDGDGLLDGKTVPNPERDSDGWPETDARARRFLDLGIAYFRTAQGKYFFIGERDRSTDPRDTDDAGIGVPSGWLAAHSIPICTDRFPGCTPTDPKYQGYYALARPGWWSEATHGPWWGGAKPNENLAALQANPDLDHDGLRDRDGQGGYEDPMPAANVANVLRPLAPSTYPHPLPEGATAWDEGTDPFLRRLLAQAFLSPQLLLPNHYSRDPLSRDDTVRTPPCLVLDDLPRKVEAGRPFTVSGSLFATCGAGATPVEDATIEARMGGPSHVFGAGFTDAEGRFSFQVNISRTHSLAVQGPHQVFRGEGPTGPAPVVVNWTSEPGAVPAGPDRLLTIRSYATPAGSPIGNLAAAIQQARIDVHSTLRIELEAPKTIVAGSHVDVVARLTDASGLPLQGTVQVNWEGASMSCPEACIATGPDGRGTIQLPTVPGPAGERKLVAEAESPNPFVAPGTASLAVKVQRPTGIALDTSGKTLDTGAATTIPGRLTTSGDARGIPVTLTLTAGGQQVATGESVTGSGGTFSIPVRLPAASPSGPAVLTVRAVETDSTRPSQAQAVVTLRGQPLFRDVETSQINAAEKAKVSARLVEADGATAVPQALVTIQLGDLKRTTRTDAQGEFLLELEHALPLRVVRQALSFDGDALHRAATNVTERTVASLTSLQVDSGQAPRGGMAVVRIRATDAQGRPLEGVPVMMAWGDEPVRYAVTSHAGLANVTRHGPVGEPLGPVQVKAIYNGSRSAGLSPATASASWVIRAPAEIMLPHGQHVAGERITPGRLVDADTGRPLPGRTLLLQLEGVNATSLLRRTTDVAGEFTVPLDPGRVLVSMQATFAGDATYASATNRSSIDQRVPTHLSLRLPAGVVAGRESIAMVQVLEPDGAAVTHGQVQVRLGGVDAGRWPIIGGTARVNWTLPASWEPGAIPVEAIYEGDASRAPSSQAGTVIVRGPITIKIQADGALAGDTTTVRVLLRAGAKALPYTQVSLVTDQMDSGLVATTDIDGVATFRLHQEGGPMRVAARFAGDAQFGPATSQAAIEPAVVPPMVERTVLPLAWMAAGLALLLTLGGLVASRLRREPLVEALKRVQDLLRGASPSYVLGAFRVLEDAAVAKGLMRSRARTARQLESALQGAVPQDVHGHLATFMAIFEEVRYGNLAPDAGRRAAALRSLERITVALRARGSA